MTRDMRAILTDAWHGLVDLGLESEASQIGSVLDGAMDETALGTGLLWDAHVAVRGVIANLMRRTDRRSRRDYEIASRVLASLFGAHSLLAAQIDDARDTQEMVNALSNGETN